MQIQQTPPARAHSRPHPTRSRLFPGLAAKLDRISLFTFLAIKTIFFLSYTDKQFPPSWGFQRATGAAGNTTHVPGVPVSLSLSLTPPSPFPSLSPPPPA
ncbi:UNVERIFIED_CONTAM: hypothetical protein K2H54_002966 [Gekko kuhli]